MPLEAEMLIERLGARGDGIGTLNGQTVYVPFSVPGDHVRVRLGNRRGGGCSAELIEVLSSGPNRVDAPCSHFGECGGCVTQHLSRDAELEWKRDLVRNALDRRGLDKVPVSDTVSIPPNSRRRTLITLTNAGGQILLGYLARGSHHVVPIQSCTVLEPELERLILPLTSLGHYLHIPRQGLQISLTQTSNGLDVVIGSRMELTLELRERLSEFARQYDLARLSWGAVYPEPVIVRRTPVVDIGGITVEPPMGGFMQASLAAEVILRKLVIDHLNGCNHIIDLFSGIGTFALALAKKGIRISAYDDDEEAVFALRRAGNRSAGRISINANVRDLLRRPLSAGDFRKIDGVVIDPPRAGAKQQCQVLSESSVRKIAYVSCAPGTFARDARNLVDGGFTLTSVVLINQFSWSRHVEVVGCLERQERTAFNT